MSWRQARFPLIPEISGVYHDNVVTAHDILSGKSDNIGHTVVILGGGSVGCETADFLCGQGKDVTIIELLDDIAVDVGVIRKSYLMKRLQKGGVKFITSVRADGIMDTGHIKISDKDGNETRIGIFDTAVLALGARSTDQIFRTDRGNGSGSLCDWRCQRIPRCARCCFGTAL